MLDPWFPPHARYDLPCSPSRRAGHSLPAASLYVRQRFWQAIATHIRAPGLPWAVTCDVPEAGDVNGRFDIACNRS